MDNYQNNAARKNIFEPSAHHVHANSFLREHIAAHCTPWEQVDPNRALGRLLWSKRFGKHLRNRTSAHHRSWPGQTCVVIVIPVDSGPRMTD